MIVLCNYTQKKVLFIFYGIDRLSCILVNQVPVLHLKYRVADDIHPCLCHLDHDIFYFPLGKYMFSSLFHLFEHERRA